MVNKPHLIDTMAAQAARFRWSNEENESEIVKIELDSAAFMRNPAPFVVALQEQGPLVPYRLPIIGNITLATTQAAASEILKDNDRFSVRKADGSVTGLRWWMPRSIKLLSNNMLTMDEPDHGRLRGLVDQAFHRREIVQLEERVTEIAEELADAMFQDGSEADLVSRFARPFPLAVICELLGLPASDRAKFMGWASGLTQVSGLWSFMRAIRGLKPMIRYLEGQIELAREGHGEGLIRDLVEIEYDGNQLSGDELLAMVFLLLVAGHETTTHLISGGFLALFEHSEQRERLVGNWNGVDLAVEEMLRYCSPVQFTKPRIARVDCEVEGVAVKKGQVLMPMLVAANFDPAVFDQPERFDIGRKPNRHMEFGTGIHFCLGNQLARMEMRVALKTLLTRYPNLHLAINADEVIWNRRVGLRALKSLPVAA